MKTALFLALAMAISTAAVPPAEAVAPESSSRSIRQSAQAEMRLTGRIDISAEGTVDGYRLDHVEKVPGYVQAYLRPIIEAWRFDPTLVDGRAVPVTSPLRLRLVGRPTGNGGFALELDNAGFREEQPDDPTEMAAISSPPPRYPKAAFEMGATGVVMVVVKVGRDGAVEDVATESVDLTTVASAATMKRMREVLANASMSAAKAWRFRTPTEGPQKDAASWLARIPVSFMLSEYRLPADTYGQWSAYIPGPREPLPWAVQGEATASRAELLPDEGVFLAGVQKGPKLLTPVGG